MRAFGKLLLSFSHWFDRWHEHHLKVGLALFVLSGIATFLKFAGLLNREVGFLGELEHWVGTFTIGFFAGYLLLFTFAKLLARIWPPPVIPMLTAVPTPLEKPAAGHWIFGGYLGTRFRYRFAREDDLGVFVEYSIADPAILIATRLTRDDRVALYERWYSYSPKSFMLLDAKPMNETQWRPFATSIVLPLSPRGVEDLWKGKVPVIALDEDHIEVGATRPAALLIDTLAVEKRDKGRGSNMVLALPKIHCTRFWKPKRREKMEYWIEPDHRVLPRLLRDCGFEGPRTIGKNHSVYRLVLPLAVKRYSERQRKTIERFVAGLKECAEWRIQ